MRLETIRRILSISRTRPRANCAHPSTLEQLALRSLALPQQSVSPVNWANVDENAIFSLQLRARSNQPKRTLKTVIFPDQLPSTSKEDKPN